MAIRVADLQVSQTDVVSRDLLRLFMIIENNSHITITYPKDT